MTNNAIEIEFGGDATDFVHSAHTAGNSVVTIEKQTMSLQKTLQKLDTTLNQSTNSMKKKGAAAKKTKDDFLGLNNIMKSSVMSIRNLITAFAGFEGVRRLVRGVLDEIRSIREETNAMANRGATMDQAAKALMNQIGGSTTMAQAEGRLLEIMKAGRLTSLSQAQGIGIAGNVAWGMLGGKAERGLVRTASEFIGRKGLGEAEGGALVEILGTMGAKSEQDVLRLQEMIFRGFRGSKAVSFGNFVMGLKKSAPELMAAGATPEQVVADIVQARASRSTMDMAAELNRQIIMALEKEDVQKAIAKDIGLSREGFIGQSYGQRRTQFAQWVSKYGQTAKGQMLLGDVLSSREIGRTKAFFTPEGVANLGALESDFMGITSEFGRNEAEKYAKLRIAKDEAMRSAAARNMIRATGTLKTGGAIWTRAESVWSRLKSKQAVDELTDQQVASLGLSFNVVGKDREVSMIATAMMRRQANDLRTRAIQSGDINRIAGPKALPGSWGAFNVNQDTFEATSDFGQSILNFSQRINEYGPGIFNKTDANMIGELQQMNEKLQMLVEQNENKSPGFD